MLEVGNGVLKQEEARAQMSLWALASAPLILGNDLNRADAATIEILGNREVIAIDQDRLGKQATPAEDGNLERWIKPLDDGSVALGVLNLGDSKTLANVRAADLHLHGTVRSARNLWTHSEVQFKNGVYTEILPPHGILLLRVRAL